MTDAARLRKNLASHFLLIGKIVAWLLRERALTRNRNHEQTNACCTVHLHFPRCLAVIKTSIPCGEGEGKGRRLRPASNSRFRIGPFHGRIPRRSRALRLRCALRDGPKGALQPLSRDNRHRDAKPERRGPLRPRQWLATTRPGLLNTAGHID